MLEVTVCRQPQLITTTLLSQLLKFPSVMKSWVWKKKDNQEKCSLSCLWGQKQLRTWVSCGTGKKGACPFFYF